MSAPRARSALKIYGKLVKDPTDLTAAYPYGGTELGLVGQIAIRPNNTSLPLTAEEWGDQVWDVLDGGTAFLLACTLRGVDGDAYSSVFLDTATGSPSGDKVIRFRADNGRAGTLRSTLAMTLLFVPDSPLRHRAVIVRDAIPVVTADSEIAMNIDEEWVLKVVFHGRPDSSNRVAEIAYIKDLAL